MRPNHELWELSFYPYQGGRAAQSVRVVLTDDRRMMGFEGMVGVGTQCDCACDCACPTDETADESCLRFQRLSLHTLS
jgi:hypothetical protein